MEKMKSKVALFLVVLVLGSTISSCLSSPTPDETVPGFHRQPRIREGTEVTDRSLVKFMGRISTCFKPLGRFTCVLCGGVLVTEEWFMTAGHCVRIPSGQDSYLKIKNITVTLGDLKKDTTEDNTQIKYADINNVKTPPAYNKKYRNDDIALVKLTSKADTTSPDFVSKVGTAQSLLALSSAGNPAETTPVMYLGWGFYDPENYLSANALRYGVANVVKSNLCNVWDANKQFCTRSSQANRYQNMCFGDAGGPVFSNIAAPAATYAPGTLIGIMSYNTPNCPKTVDGGQYRHTTISSLRQWMSDATGGAIPVT